MLKNLRHPAILVFAVLWIASALAIALGGGRDVFLSRLPVSAGFMLLALITIRITQPAPPTTAADGVERRKVGWQLAVIAAVIALTALDGLVFHGIVPADSPLAFMAGWRARLGQWVNPLYYFVIPFLLLLLLGARPRGLGFGPGHRVWLVLAVWLALPVIWWAVSLATGGLTLSALLGRFASHALQNGFFEEFLFRGALQTRLRKLVSPTSAVVISSLVFGLWHLGAAYSDAGSLPGAMAVCIYGNAVSGLAFGIIMERTRNLLAPSVVHIATNSIG